MPHMLAALHRNELTVYDLHTVGKGYVAGKISDADEGAVIELVELLGAIVKGNRDDATGVFFAIGLKREALVAVYLFVYLAQLDAVERIGDSGVELAQVYVAVLVPQTEPFWVVLYGVVCQV